MTHLRLVRRRRWLSPRVLIVVAVVAAVGLVVAIVVGRSERAAGDAGITPVEATTVATCQTVEHSVEGATLTAVDGLRALAQANLTPPAVDVEATLKRYVTPERRPLMRTYLKSYPGPFVAIDMTVLAWDAVSYTSALAVVRVATSDVATTSTGDQKMSQAVTAVSLEWDATQDWWRLADWDVGAANVADVVDGGYGVPCHA